MIVQHHDLLHEFPEMKDKIHQLKTGDNHFRKLFDEYHKLDHEVRRIEEGAEATSDEYLENLKKRRISLKDELYSMLKKAA